MHTFSPAAGRYLCNECIMNDWLNKWLVPGWQVSQGCKVQCESCSTHSPLQTSHVHYPLVSSVWVCPGPSFLRRPSGITETQWFSRLCSTYAPRPVPSVTRITPLILIQYSLCSLRQHYTVLLVFRPSLEIPYGQGLRLDPQHPALGLHVPLSVEVEVAKLWWTHPFLTLNFR